MALKWWSPIDLDLCLPSKAWKSARVEMDPKMDTSPKLFWDINSWRGDVISSKILGDLRICHSWLWILPCIFFIFLFFVILDDETSYLGLLTLIMLSIKVRTRACLRPNEEKFSFYFYVYFIFSEKENKVK